MGPFKKKTQKTSSNDNVLIQQGTQLLIILFISMSSFPFQRNKGRIDHRPPCSVSLSSHVYSTAVYLRLPDPPRWQSAPRLTCPPTIQPSPVLPLSAAESWEN